jgi:anti-sigma regulatory factor (Ser/Thr protein kinase)
MASSADRSTSGSSTSLTISNRISELARVTTWLAQAARQFALPERTVFSLDLVLDEALTNIINYAYQDQRKHDIAIKLENRDDQVLLEITDDGAAFNPFEQDSFQESPDLDSATIGGRGIHLIKSFTDTQNYQRINHQNRLLVGIFKHQPTR